MEKKQPHRPDKHISGERTTAKSPPGKPAPGQFMGVTIVDPAVRPQGTTVAAIRRAVQAAVKQPIK